jgi:hypothetical protein
LASGKLNVSEGVRNPPNRAKAMMVRQTQFGAASISFWVSSSVM